MISIAVRPESLLTSTYDWSLRLSTWARMLRAAPIQEKRAMIRANSAIEDEPKKAARTTRTARLGTPSITSAVVRSIASGSPRT